MANRYVYSGAAGTATGTDWTNAHTTLAAAITASTAGDVFYVAHDHAETTAAAVTLGFKGNWPTPDRVLCVNRAGSVPPVAADLATTGTVSTTGASNLTINGEIYCYGLTFTAGNLTSAVNLQTGTSGDQTFEKCVFALGGSNGGGRINIGTSGANATDLIDVTLSFTNAAQGIGVSGWWRWKNNAGVAALAGTVPTILIPSSISNWFRWEGLDLSALASGKTILGATTRPSVPANKIVNCKLGASVTISAISGGFVTARLYLELIGCSDTSVNYRNERHTPLAILTTETTIKRTGGASDGTTGFSHKIVSNSSNKRDFPFDTFEGVIWNDTTGSAKTLTVHCVTDNVTLTDAEIWLEVDYLGSSATPISTLVSDGAATPLTAGTNQASDSGTAWTTTGLATPVKQSLDVTFTPQMKGPVRWRVKFAKASTTVYICPKADLV